MGGFSLSFPDKELVKWFKENKNKIEYINHEPTIDNYKRKEKLLEEIGKLDEDNLLFKQKSILLDIWRDLLGSAIVFLKSMDNRERYHDDEDYGVEKLDKVFRAFSDFETLFYGADEYYRDHISHMFRVFLVGEILIREKLGYDNIKVGINLEHHPISNAEKEAMWCIISLTHDIGYGINKIPDINKKTRDMLKNYGISSPQDLSYNFQIQPLHNYIIRFISSNIASVGGVCYTNHIQSKYFLKFSGAFERSNHGIMSCVLLMRNLVYFLESDYTLDKNKPLNEEDAKHFLIRREILRSIASHDCDDIYYLKVCDFSFLLTIIDEMQEWDRPSLSDLFKKPLPMELGINTFTDKSVEYQLIFLPQKDLNPDEKKAAKKAATKFFIRKCEKIRRILRSAVDGAHRDFTLDFTVKDQIDSENIIYYSIVHRNPEDVRYYENINDKKYDEESEKTWQELKMKGESPS